MLADPIYERRVTVLNEGSQKRVFNEARVSHAWKTLIELQSRSCHRKESTKTNELVPLISVKINA